MRMPLEILMYFLSLALNFFLLETIEFFFKLVYMKKRLECLAFKE